MIVLETAGPGAKRLNFTESKRYFTFFVILQGPLRLYEAQGLGYGLLAPTTVSTYLSNLSIHRSYDFGPIGRVRIENEQDK